MTTFVVDFDHYRPECRPLVGSKNATLSAMRLAGFPVPPGFAITTHAFETPHDARVADSVAAAYHRLCQRCGVVDVPVAVRSSATAEDSSEASFAGAYDTFLGVRGVDDVLRHVARCWSSLWTARATSYRAKTGKGDTPVAMSVGVQEMVAAKAAGVALTLNPTDGDRSQVAIEASWGLGQAVVAGEVTPDQYLVDKVVFEITRRRVSTKRVEYQLCGGGVARRDVPPERAASPCLTDTEILSVARLARRVERHFGTPQDIEWAVDDAEAPHDVVLLQARPETVWSRSGRAGARPVDGLTSIVSTLCSPLHARETGR